MWKNWIRFLVFGSVLGACSESPPYRKLSDGTEWKLLAFTDQDRRLDSAALFFMEAVIMTSTGDTLSYFFDRGFEPASDSLSYILASRFVGDSLEVIRSKPDFLNQEVFTGDTLIYRMRIDRMRTRREMDDARIQELALLDSLLRVDSISSNYKEHEGVYIRSLSRGDTSAVLRGREIVIHYQGRTPEGRVFDDSRRMDAPLRFVFGNEGQVIKGLELALAEMNKGDATEVIVPSWLAFGSRGSAAGHVAPYTPVIYRLEVLEVGK